MVHAPMYDWFAGVQPAARRAAKYAFMSEMVNVVVGPESSAPPGPDWYQPMLLMTSSYSKKFSCPALRSGSISVGARGNSWLPLPSPTCPVRYPPCPMAVNVKIFGSRLFLMRDAWSVIPSLVASAPATNEWPLSTTFAGG